MRKWLAVPLLAVGLWFVGASLPALAASPTDTGGEQESLESILGRVVCIVDNFGIVYNLNVGGGSITGTANAGCPNLYSVSGSNVGASFTFTASGGDGVICCESFTYTGVADKPSRTASGTWSNVCNGSGSFTAGLCP